MTGRNNLPLRSSDDPGSVPVSSWTIGSLLETVSAYLRDKGCQSPRLDAELLLAEALGKDRVYLYLEYERPLSGAELAAYRPLVARRARREPVAYILGRAHFRRLVLEVTPAVLIPRPETEELVDVAIEILRRKPLWENLPLGSRKPGERGAPGFAPAPPSPLVADVGCGSGAVALSLAQEVGVWVLATDISEEALAVAERNCHMAGLEGLVELRQSDLLGGFSPQSLRVVVSNPPYIPSSEIKVLEPEIRSYEPVAALDGGEDGLDVYRRLLPQAATVLKPGGALVVEVGEGQAAAVSALAVAAGFCTPTAHRDLSGKERVIEATMPGAEVLPLSGLSTPQTDAVRSLLQAGGIIGLPTDTVYGLAAAWNSSQGVRRLFAAKGRAPAQPVAVIFPSVEAVRTLLPDLDEVAGRVLNGLLPGPYTFIVSTQVPRPELVGTSESLGVRVPDHPALSRFLASVGLPVAATSANLTGEPAAATLAQVAPVLLAHCSVAFAEESQAGGTGVASTVVDLRPLSAGQPPLVLREGAVSAAEVARRIEAVL